MRNGILYVIRMGKTTWHKIGYADNLKARLSGLQTGNPTKLTVVIARKIHSPKTIESQLHQKYYRKRGPGEWFKLTDKDIEDIREKLSKTRGPIKEPKPTIKTPAYMKRYQTGQDKAFTLDKQALHL